MCCLFSEVPETRIIMTHTIASNGASANRIKFIIFPTSNLWRGVYVRNPDVGEPRTTPVSAPPKFMDKLVLQAFPLLLLRIAFRR